MPLSEGSKDGIGRAHDVPGVKWHRPTFSSPKGFVEQRTPEGPSGLLPPAPGQRPGRGEPGDVRTRSRRPHVRSQTTGRRKLSSLQLPPGVGPPGVPLGALGASFLCALLAAPGAQLLLLLFRRGEVRESAWAGPGSPLGCHLSDPPPLQEASTPAGAQPPRGTPSEAAQGERAPGDHLSVCLKVAVRWRSLSGGQRHSASCWSLPPGPLSGCCTPICTAFITGKLGSIPRVHKTVSGCPGPTSTQHPR